MKRSAQNPAAQTEQAGYALLLVMFFLALLVLGTVAVAPDVLTNGKREKEKEMVWRGQQYVRGVRMYYFKFHKFPTSLDDLTKPKNGIRFMRQAYKDPMNASDGSWRLIYVGPNGQLIGSLQDRSMGGIGMMGSNLNALQGSTSSFGSGSLSGSSFGGSSFGSSSFGSSGFGTTSAMSTSQNLGGAQGIATQNPGAAAGSDANAASSSSDMGVPHDLGPMDASSVIGGNIIGVGSKINQKSVMWYEKAKNYRQFEFIWDPSKDLTVGGASRGIGTPVQNLNAPNPSGTGLSGTNSPLAPQPNPNPGGNPDVPLQAPPPNP
ncbi:MAG TPA: hypothetical protein VEI54_00760 [Candidatus Limnocylindrales bacterium]|nr:hypothetical protein [Candidatus Limnocylindrales bacterium]